MCPWSCNETPFSLLRALERGQNWILGPASSAGAQSRNVPFIEDIVKLVARTNVAVINSHPSIPPPLEIVMSNNPPP